jgi:hypothetical protein
MKQRSLLAILWPACFAAVALLAGGAFLIAAVVGLETSHLWTDGRQRAVIWIFRFVLFLSPVVGLILARRGILPGTKVPEGATGRSRIPFALTLIVIVIGGFFTWIATLAPSDRPHVSLSVLSYTNDAVGNGLATFGVTNLSSSAVLLWPLNIELPASVEGNVGSPRYNIPGGLVLHGRASKIFTVSPSKNPPHWRLVMLVYPDTIPVRFIKLSGTHILESLWLRPKYTVKFYSFYSDWIGSGKKSGI